MPEDRPNRNECPGSTSAVCRDGVLMKHMGQKHGDQVLLEDSVGQLRWLNRQVCEHCGAIRSQLCRRCNSCGFDTPLRELCVGDTFHDSPGSGNPAATPSVLAASASRRIVGRQLVSELSNSGHRSHRARQAGARRASPGIGDGTPAMLGLSPRHGFGRKS